MFDYKFSIVTVCYNAELWIEQAIVSVINQRYNNIEYIIVDGGSKDTTLDIINKYNHRIAVCVSEPDHGVYDAMNKALDLATGDFIIFLGADDHFLSDDTLSAVSKFIDDNNAIYYGDVYRNTRNDLYRGRFNKYLLACENICHQAIFYPKSVYKMMKYDLRYPIYADYIYNIRNWNIHIFKYMPICISYYNCKGLSGTNISKSKDDVEILKEIRHNLGFDAYIIRRVYKIFKKLL